MADGAVPPAPNRKTASGKTSRTPRKKKQGGLGKGFKSLLRVLIIFGLLGVLVAIFVPAPIRGEGSERDDEKLRSVRQKLLSLDAARSANGSFQVSFTEEELNAYLYDVTMHRNQVANEGTQLRPEVINVNIGDGAIDLMVRSSFHILPVSYQLRLAPSPDGTGFEPSPVSASLGWLPMPLTLKQMVFQKMKVLFSGLPAERRLWSDLSAMEAKAGVITIRRDTR